MVGILRSQESTLAIIVDEVHENPKEDEMFAYILEISQFILIPSSLAFCPFRTCPSLLLEGISSMVSVAVTASFCPSVFSRCSTIECFPDGSFRGCLKFSECLCVYLLDLSVFENF